MGFLKKTVVFFVTVVTLSFVYSSSFLSEFAVHNDYRARDHLIYTFDTSSMGGMLQHDESMHLLYIGRPLNAILFNYQQSKLKQIGDFAVARVISFCTLLVIGIGLYIYIKKRYKVSSSYLLLILIGMILLPSSALYINWISNYIPGPFNLALAFISWILFDFGLNSKGAVRAYSFCFMAYILLLCSFLIYPATSFFFLFVPFIRIFFDRTVWSIVRREVILSMIFIVCAMVTYYVLHKKVLFPYFQELFGSKFESYDSSTYSFSFSFNKHFFSLVWEIVLTGLKLFSINMGLSIFFIINLVLVSMAMLMSYALPTINTRASLRDKNTVISQKIFFSILLFGLTLSPILLSSNGFVAYRVLYVFYAMSLVLCVYSYSVVFFVLKLYNPISKQKLTLCVTLVFVITSFINNIAIVNNSRAEYEYFRERLQLLPKLLQKNNSRQIKIFVVLPERYQLFVDYGLSYDLAYTATNYSGLMWSIIHLITESNSIDRNSYKIYSLNRGYESNYKIPFEFLTCSDCLVIDTTKIQKFKLSQLL